MGVLLSEECCFLPDPCELIPPWYQRLRLEGTILYARVGNDGLDYVVKRTLKGGRLNQHISDISLNWSLGYRVGFDWQLPQCNWEWGFHWTHYDSRSSSTRRIKGKSGQNVAVAFPVIHHPAVIVPAGQLVEAHGRLKSRFEFYDLDFSQWCSCDGFSYFRPIAGVRLAAIHQNMRVKSPLGLARVKNEHKGIGLKAGFDAQHLICGGWSVVGGLSGALIWGEAEYKNKYILGVFEDRLVEHTRVFRPILDAHAGIEWCWDVCDSNQLRLKVEWEFHYLFNQFRYFISDLPLNGVVEVKTNSNVTLQGVSLSGFFEF
jgi:hypothetical protein